ncbi:MAG: prepilin-type N-terminal cleavage/methylation domain-containing protein [Phycisphaerales bacterium]|nr:MAG: prepilin-type N-terminal cleavage/methylation domain-containing protein [Phycisphaerales bacterium]
MKATKRAVGFNLVELVIVVVIIGVVAAIAVPRISRAARGAADSAVRADLAALRNAVDLYYAEHNGEFPGQDRSQETLVQQLTGKTDVFGNTGATQEHIYGPYLPGGVPALSVGPNRGATGVRVAETGPTVDETAVDIGWVYNCRTGDIIANTDDVDEAGIGYDIY